VKPENFLLGQPGSADDKKLYLIDLGLGIFAFKLVVFVFDSVSPIVHNYWSYLIFSWLINVHAMHFFQLLDGKMHHLVYMLIMTRDLIFSGL